MVETLKDALDAANKTDKLENNFSDADLKIFTGLIADADTYKMLTDGFDDQTTIDDIKTITGLETTVKSYVSKSTLGKDVFDKKYADLTKDDEKNLYEVCVLGALLEATKETIALDTQAAAKDYFTENHKEVAPESPDMIKGTYDTAKAELKPETTETIKSTIEANKNMTNASITVSAGADLRLMTLATAQALQQEKIAALIALEDDFTDAKNKAEIDSIVAEIEDTTSVESILDNGTGATDNSEQNGNRYLIAARIAEGFIGTLTKLKAESPQPALTLTVDWDNCKIGESKTKDTDVEDDRFVHIDLKLKVTAANTSATVTNTSTVIPKSLTTGGRDTSSLSGIIGTNPLESSTTNTTSTTPAGKGDADIENKGTTTTNTANTSNKGAAAPNSTTTSNTANTITNTGKTSNEIAKAKESEPNLGLISDIQEHFKMDAKDIDAQNVTDIVQDKTDLKKFTVTINGYTGFIVRYTTDTSSKPSIEIQTGTVSKGLLKRKINATKNIQATIDRKLKDRTAIKKDFTLELDTDKSLIDINKKLLTCASSTLKQGKFYIENKADISKTSLKIQYINTDAVDKVNAKDVVDNFTLKLDDNFMLTNDTTPKGTTPLEWQSVPGTQAMICKKPYLIYDLPTDSKLTYFAKTSGGTDDPTLQVINNIKSDVMSGTTAVTAPLFTPYTDVSLQQESTEAYSEKVKLTYDTPSTTSAEKQFQKGAYIKYKESDGTCVLTTTFDVLSGTPVTLTIDGTYTPGSKTNQNTSSIKFDGLALNRTDTYNKTIGKNKVMIDGIVYYVGVTTDKQKHIPTVVFSHVEDDTLEAVDGWTEKYKITSNVFGEKLANNKVENYDKVNTGFGDCAYGPLRIVSGQRADPIKYSKDINLGQVKGEDKRILVQGTKIGTMYFDQHGSFLEYKTETAKMTFPKQTDKADISTHTPLGVKEPLSQKDKNILITSTLDEKTGLLTIDMMSTDDAYDGKKTGKTLIEDPSLEATAEQKKVSNYLTQAETMSQIATNRIKVYEALRHLSSANITKENQKLFNFAYEADKTPNVVVGPSFEGVYAYKLVNKETTAKGINYPAQYIYCKVIDNKIALCDANGDALTQQKIIIKSTKDYYVVSVDDVVTGTKTTQQFKIDAKKDKTEERTPEIDTFEVEKDYTKYTGDLTAERYCSFRAYDSTSLTDSYKFDEKDGYTSLDIKVNAGQISGTDKVTGVQSFDIVDQDQDDFGSYKEFFTTKEQKNLGISEKAYKTAFNNILEDETKKTDDLVRVKYKGTDGKYYYALMHADIDQRKGKNEVTLTPDTGRETAITTMEERLATLVKAVYHTNFEQDTNKGTMEGETVQGRYLIKPTSTEIEKYLNDPTQNINFTIRTNVKLAGGGYEETTITFDPEKETLTPSKVNFNKIDYKLALQSDSTDGYKIVIEKKKITQ